jgi:GH15 family glucan-1,4-alpha-glucosidase
MGRGAGDGLTGGEGTFNMCTFWLVEALTTHDQRQRRWAFPLM